MIKKYNPTSPGIRTRKTVIRSELSGVKPQKALKKPLKGHVGRSNGKVTIRFRERGAKKHYRIVDFKRNKHEVIGVVKSIEYDPNRGPNIALVCYMDGEKRYILAPEGLKVGSKVVSGSEATPSLGNALPLSKIPLGFEIHNIEINPGKGGQMVRGAGNKAIILAKENNYVNVKLPSGEVKKFLETCYATIGALGNADHRNVRLGKAGKKRHLGRRPHVRGVAMSNPSDHPHAGSYSDNGTGHPMTPWGKPTRGKKTRKRRHTDKYIVTPRRKRRK